MCRQLGYEKADIISNHNATVSTIPIYKTNVDCGGHEAKLIDCLDDVFLTPTCESGHAAFISCKGQAHFISLYLENILNPFPSKSTEIVVGA